MHGTIFNSFCLFLDCSRLFHFCRLNADLTQRLEYGFHSDWHTKVRVTITQPPEVPSSTPPPQPSSTDGPQCAGRGVGVRKIASAHLLSSGAAFCTSGSDQNQILAGSTTLWTGTFSVPPSTITGDWGVPESSKFFCHSSAILVIRKIEKMPAFPALNTETLFLVFEWLTGEGRPKLPLKILYLVCRSFRAIASGLLFKHAIIRVPQDAEAAVSKRILDRSLGFIAYLFENEHVHAQVRDLYIFR
ncbi:hypothetical protein K458DRAFT_382658 [Lentithecium fluviatile CBS 122367]|uniref:Uncharacterized protein n=1 Tax=Lentithecium fluviatile CBS 122367 TaxID=1168545 RepID=A0A6G1JLH2_9PLEO|nr:hypothetical protein K458DRAFT_382658 [Lentithecium fluviatile CBS 122367]